MATPTTSLPAGRRLAQVHRALAAAATEATKPQRAAPRLPPTAALVEQASLTADGLILLNDQEVQRFWCATNHTAGQGL